MASLAGDSVAVLPASACSASSGELRESTRHGLALFTLTKGKTMENPPKKNGDPEQWAEDFLHEIEDEFAPEVFTLEEYRSHLQALADAVRSRTEQLDEEIG